MDIRSTNGVNDHLKALERKGYLLRGEQQSRALVPTKRARLVLGMGAPRRDSGMVEVPLLGKVAAGARCWRWRTSRTRSGSTASCWAGTARRSSPCG